MVNKNVEREIKDLTIRIENLNNEYYNNNTSIVDDKTYDILVKELKTLEDKYPELKKEDSPTNKVGASPKTGFEKVKHEFKMLSLDNTYNIDEISKWLKTVIKKSDNRNWIIEPKVDGVSISLIYKNGKLVQALTRGDGLIGENVTNNVKQIPSIPQTINYKENLTIRGEIYISKNDFQMIKGKYEFSNSRNAASGSIRLKDANEIKNRKLSFFPHTCVEHFKSQNDFLNFCGANNFVVPQFYIDNSVKEIIDRINKLDTERLDYSYDVDGIVIKVDEIEVRNKLGNTEHHPNWAVAYKYQTQKISTIIKNIFTQVSRNGIITPVAEFVPVALGGVTITYATLHNFDEINRLNINIGDRVFIERRGEVIPKVVALLDKNSTGVYQAPINCPCCGSKLKKYKNAFIKCENKKCPDQIYKTVLHAIGRDALNIEGLGNETIEQLTKNGLSTIYDIFKLTKKDLEKLPLFKDKKIDNILSAINKAKVTTEDKLLYSLGMLFVGRRASKSVMQIYNTIDDMINDINANKLDKRITPAIADSLTEYFKDKNNVADYKKLRKELKMQQTESNTTGKLNGLAFIFTGALSKPRNIYENIIIKNGGKISASINKDTTYLVTNDPNSNSSKNQKAKKLGTKIINEEQLLEIL
jgi:DNA ligase (NAD+)